MVNKISSSSSFKETNSTMGILNFGFCFDFYNVFRSLEEDKNKGYRSKEMKREKRRGE